MCAGADAGTCVPRRRPTDVLVLAMVPASEEFGGMPASSLAGSVKDRG